MESIKRTVDFDDQVDRFVEDLARHPERLEDLKRKLRRNLGMAQAFRPRAVPATEPGDVEDLWDNVPV